MKFKVGDRVKHKSWGKGTIRYIDNGHYLPYAVEFDEGFMAGDACGGSRKDKHGLWCNEDELKLVSQEFTKSDLKDGDVVTYRCGDKRIVQGKDLNRTNGERGYNLDEYRKDLTEKDNFTYLDIIEVKRPVKYETIFKRKEEILNKTEKRYLSGVIRPFRDNVDYIRKEKWNDEECYIEFGKKNSIVNAGSLPVFNKDIMYKGMEVDKDYTLEELGI